MYTTYRLNSMPSAQCCVTMHFSDKGILEEVTLTSYATEVCRILHNTDGTFSLWCSGTYSATTARHINRFTTEFCGENKYHECKRALMMRPAGCAGSFVGVCDVPFETFHKAFHKYVNDGKRFYGKY